ncbi:MAG: ATP synthase F1 subunit delta [Lactobacillaceae bacterium]|nr:ATP synthase F1 subunit delta [Lactobacillaceae bacterium]
MKKKTKIQISSTYAEAWYEAALQEKELDKAFADGKKLEKAFIPGDIKELSNPVLPKIVKEKIISNIGKKLNLSVSTQRFLDILNENKRLDEIFNIIRNFNSLYFKAKNIVEVCVQTVKPLNASQDDRLKKNLENFLAKDVVINYDIRADIIGGLKIMYDTYEIDDSVKGKLEKMESIMKGSE